MASFAKTQCNGRRTLYDWFPGNASLAMESLDRHIRANMIVPENFVRAVVCDNGIVNNNSDDPKNYALKFYSQDEKESYWIAGLSVGKRSSGSYGMIQALVLMGFDADGERDIYNLPQGKRKVFTKKNK